MKNDLPAIDAKAKIDVSAISATPARIIDGFAVITRSKFKSHGVFQLLNFVLFHQQCWLMCLPPCMPATR
jgi:hypothetical protein